MPADQSQDQYLLAANRWPYLQTLPWWRAFEDCCHLPTFAALTAAVCLVERTVWALGAQYELVDLNSYSVQDETTSASEVKSPSDFIAPELTASTAIWLIAQLVKHPSIEAQASMLIEDARQRLLFSLLHGANTNASLAKAALRLFPLEQMEALLSESLLMWLSEISHACGSLSGTWLKTGELDSPLLPGKLEEIASREPLSAQDLLQSELVNGGCLIIANDDESIHLETLLPMLIEQYRNRGRLPLLLHGQSLRWREQLAYTLQDYMHWLMGSQTLARVAKPRTLLLSRPDRAFVAGVPVDGLEIRRAIAEWQNHHPEDLVIVLVARTCLLARHPLPSSIILKPKLPESLLNAESCNPWLPVPLREENIPQHLLKRFITEVQTAGQSPTLTLAQACYELLSYNGRKSVDHNPVLLEILSEDKWTKRLLLEQLLRDFILQRWQSRQDFRAYLEDKKIIICAPANMDASVGVALYRLLKALTPEGERETFIGVDLGRWLCFLRAHGYEMIARVLDCMERERLTNVNLVHAPPLEYANLKQANLEGADLYHINLAEADLRNAKLSNSDLSRAHLKRADLRGADLQGADLSYSCLEQANLSGANLSGVNLYRAITDDAIGLSYI